MPEENLGRDPRRAAGTFDPVRPQDLGIGRLFERVRDAVIVADAWEGRIVLWNPAAEEVFGYRTGEALAGLDVEALVPGELKGRHRMLILAQ